MFFYLEDGNNTLPKKSVSTRLQEVARQTKPFFRNELDRLYIKCKLKLFQRNIIMMFKMFQNINTDSPKFNHISLSKRWCYGYRPDVAEELAAKMLKVTECASGQSWNSLEEKMCPLCSSLY
jgi:hypothetical protein